MTAPTRPARVRRRPEDAEREILDATDTLLRAGSYADLTVASVMARTGLGRSSFYVYFADVPAVLRRLAERQEGEFLAVSRAWLEGEGDVDAALRSIEGIVAVYVRHGPVLRALGDAATRHPEVDAIFRYGVIEHFIDAVHRRCAQQHQRGRIPHPVSRDVARALVLMNERYLADIFGRDPLADQAGVVAALHTVWARVLYGADALPAPRSDDPPG